MPQTPSPAMLTHRPPQAPYMAIIALKKALYSSAVGSASSGSSMSASGSGSGSGSASSSVGSGAGAPPPPNRRARFAWASCSSAAWSGLSLGNAFCSPCQHLRTVSAGCHAGATPSPAPDPEAAGGAPVGPRPAQPCPPYGRVGGTSGCPLLTDLSAISGRSRKE